MHAIATAAIAGLVMTALPAAALADQINTGGESGAYHSRFCPQLSDSLAKSQFDYACKTSEGSRDNIQRVIKKPREIGYAQFDIYALEKTMLGGDGLFETLRTDMGRECLFMVTKNKDIEHYGQVAAMAEDLRFILPPEASGSAATFEFLQQIDPNGLGRAADITYATSTDDALEQALSATDTVTLFVQFPNPDNARFAMIQDMEGHAVPVIDRNILRQRIDNRKIYFAQETEVSNASWLSSGATVVTSCTPIVLFTGAPSMIDDATARQDHEDLISTVRAIDAEALQPEEGFFKRIWKRTKELSAKSVEKAVELSETAREEAAPALDAAKKKGSEWMEKAGQMAEDAQRKAGELVEQTRKKSEEMMNEGGEGETAQ